MLKSFPGICFCLFLTITSCSRTESLTPEQSTIIKDSVQQMAARVAKDVSADGPIAWLRYFENNPEFFMAFDGLLAFSNNDSATASIKNTVVKQINNIELSWSHIRIDPLTPKFAGFAANWHEDITYSTGNKLPYDGYFTAVAEKASEGWQFRNAHWSVAKSK